MQNKGMPIEVKVGALVLFSLGLLVAFILVLGDFSMSKGFVFQVEFGNAGGLKPGADVAIAGLNVGSVRELRFIENKDKQKGQSAVAVQATLFVEPQFSDAIREDSKYFITTRGVLGEPYIEIVTQSYKKPAIKVGAVVRGVEPPRMDLIISKGATLLESLIDLLDNPNVALKDLVGNTSKLITTINLILEGNRKDIDATFEGVHVAVDEAGILMKSLNVAVDGGDELRGIVADLRASTRDLKVTSRHARNISSRVDTKLDPILDDVSVLSTDARVAASSLKSLFVTNEPKITRSIDNVHKATLDLKGISKDAKTIVKKVKTGEGTVGQLLHDRELYDDMREVLRQIKRQPWKIIWKE